MNINRVGQFSYEAFKKVSDNKLSDKGTQKDQGSNIPIKDGFVKNSNIENFLDDVSQLSAFAKAAPEIREEKLTEVSNRIANGYYSKPQFIDSLAERLAG